MKFYYVHSDCEGAPYKATLDEAKKLARHEAEDSYDDIKVSVVDIATDKENVLRILNSAGGTTSFGETVYTAKGRKKGDD